MKIISLQKNLKSSLYSVSHIAQKNTNLPILNNVLLSAKDGVIKLISTNLEIGITSILRGKIEQEGTFTVDARVFTEYVNLLPNEKVEITLKDTELVVNCGDNKTKIKGLTAEEFPFIPEVKQVDPYCIPVEDFKKATSQVIFAAALDESRAELSGILFTLSNKKITLVGTDSYRLAEKHITVTNSSPEEHSCIIPTRTLQEVLRVLSSELSENADLEEITFYLSENQCLFVIGNTEIVSRIINGRYPDYQQIIPQRHESKVVVNKDDLSRAVKAATLFSRNGVNDVVLATDSTKKNVAISASSGQTGEHISTLTATVSGQNVTITLNSRYILDVLGVLSEDSVSIELVDDNTPCVVRDGSDTSYLYIIMPIRS